MRIGIDCRLILDKPTGIGSYTVGLVRDLLRIDRDNEYVLIVRDKIPSGLSEVASDRADYARCPLPPMGPKQKLFARKYLKPLNLDVYHYPHHDLPLGMDRRAVVTIHHLPEPGVSSGPHPAYNRLLTTSIGWAVKRARRAIAVSRFTANRLIERFDHREKIVAIYPPLSDLFDCTEERPLPPPLQAGRYFLFVGQRRPHKNIESLIRALAASKDLEEVQLAIVGPAYKDYRNPEATVKSLGLDDRVYMPGAVDRALLRTLYRNALALVLPSFIEGFGYPLVEAFHFGLPVICSDRGSLPEIVGDAGLVVDPSSVDEIASALQRIANDASLRQELGNRAQRRAAQFAGERSAREVLRVYEEVAGSR